MSEYRRKLLASSGLNQGLPPGTTFDFPYTGTVQEITLPKGVYLLECWGAQGGGFNVPTIKMNGGYSSGYLSLKSRTVLFVFVGGAGKHYMGNNQNTIVNGGWNGGGGGRNFIDYGNYYFLSGSGGGATDISLVSSSMDYVNGRTNRSKESLLSRIIVAGGGSGGGEYNSPSQSLIYEGSHGGGVSGGGYYPGTQNAATGGDAGFGYGSNITGRLGGYFSAGGGGGWYGGGYQPENSWWSVTTSGGSGFVNVAANAKYRPEGYTGLELESGETKAGSEYMPSPSGGSELGHANDGYARITALPEKLDYRILDASGVAIMSIYGNFYADAKAWDADGRPAANGVAISDGEHRFCVGGKDLGSKPWGGYEKLIPGVTTITNSADWDTDFSGVANTDAIVAEVTSSDGWFEASPWSAAGLCRQYLFPNGSPGYLGATGEWKLVRDSLAKVNEFMSTIGFSSITFYHWSSTQYNNETAWIFDRSLSMAVSKYADHKIRAFCRI